MPTKRRKHGAPQLRHADAMPICVQHWLVTGRTVPGNDSDAWQTSILKYDRALVSGTKFWTRQDLRELGYGDRIDAHVAAGRCPPDGWRTPGLAAV